MNPFVVNRHGRLVFPSNFFPDLDFTVFETLNQFMSVIRRDFEAKAPTGTDIVERVESGNYRGRFDLLRDMALHLTWVNRYALTMYEKRPTRWSDVPRLRQDVFLPILTPWEDGERKIGVVESAYRALPWTWDGQAEDDIFALLFDVFGHKRHHATELPPIKPTVAEILESPRNLTFLVKSHERDYATFSYDEIIDCSHSVPELEALRRQAMVLHNQYPWDRSQVRLVEVGELSDDDVVVVFVPRSREVLGFIDRVRAGRPPRSRAAAPEAEPRHPVTPYPPVRVAERYTVMPRLEALAVARGEYLCTNEDLIRNTAYSWSPMTAEEISSKTGIEARCYTALDLEDIALDAAQQALYHANRGAEEIGAVVFCSCTSTRLIPSVATWLSGQLGIYQTQGSFDLVAACAGLSYGLRAAVQALQEVSRPVLLVCAEKFSDKIGTVRPSRMIFGDAAAAIVIAPAPKGAAPDIEVLQTYASGPVSEVNSIIWPNPAFGNNITVYGPEVRNLVKRYLTQMMEELSTQPATDGSDRTLLDTIELVVPHQANKSMVVELATAAGLRVDQLYFNIEQVGNASAASIPLAIFDAVREGVIDRPLRIFAPGFGAGAVGGYAVLRVDPAMIALTPMTTSRNGVAHEAHTSFSSDDVRMAFG